MSEQVKCRTTLMGWIFGHKFYYRIRAAGVTQTTSACVRCGWGASSAGLRSTPAN